MKRSGAKIAELNKEHAATKKDMSDLKKEMEDALDVLRDAERRVRGVETSQGLGNSEIFFLALDLFRSV